MFFAKAELESVGLELHPSQYVQEIGKTTAEAYLEEMRFPGAEWEIRDGFPYLVKLDKVVFREELKISGLSIEEIDAYVETLADPAFNENNRRSLHHLRLRLDGCRNIATRLWGSEHKFLEEAPIGVAMLGFFNAGAHPVPAGGSAILMNYGLCYLQLYLNLQYQYQKWYPTPPPPADATDELTRFAKAIFGDVDNRKEFLRAALRKSDDVTLLISNKRCNLSYLFVLLHEYGHIALGHTEETRKWGRLSGLPDRQRKMYCAVLRGWEYDADRFAFDVLTGKKAPPGTPLPSSRDLKLMLEDVFATMMLAMNHKTIELPGDTHPLPKHRIFKLCGAANDAEVVEWLTTVEDELSDGEAFLREMLKPIMIATGDVIDDALPTQ